MDRILLVAATLGEIRPLLDTISIRADDSGPLLHGAGKFDALITGVGQMQTAFHLGRILSKDSHRLVLNLGIAGSFKDAFSRGSVVQIVREELSDLGAEGGLDLFEMKLLNPNLPPFKDGALHASGPALESLADLPRVRSVTVNRVLHSEQSIEAVCRRYDPDVVNMEGAAVFYACGSLGIPALAIRSISDKVSRRDKSQWDIPGAVRALCDKAQETLRELAD